MYTYFKPSISVDNLMRIKFIPNQINKQINNREILLSSMQVLQVTD